MNCSLKRMEVWLGSSKEDATKTNGWIRAWQTCGLGVRWYWWPASFSEMPKPRLVAHVHQDARAEQRYLLLDIYHKS